MNNRKEDSLGHKIKGKDLKRLESFKKLIVISLSFICILLEILIFANHWQNYFYGSLVTVSEINYYFWGHILEITIYSVLLFFFSTMYGGMRIGYLKNVESIFSQVFATIAVNIFLYAQLSLMANQLFLPRYFIQMTFFQILAVIIWINISNKIYKTVFPPRKLLLVHGERPIQDIWSKFNTRRDKYIIAGFVHIKIGIEEIFNKILKGYEDGEYHAVVIGDINVDERNRLLKFCYNHSIRIYIMPKITDVILLGAEEMHLFDTPLMLTREYCLSIEQRFLKRLMDIICAMILLIVASPFMLVTAIIIKLYDGGPILYKQRRCTLGQREFFIMKFRSMHMDAEKDGVARLAIKNDSRITPIGKWIRKVRIDELPQLFNILKGDMAFIGPRPERPEIIEQYIEIMPEFAFRMKVKAGLAGYAQVYGKYNTSPYDKLKLDLMYIEKYSLWLDLKLILLTLKILFSPDSTEGVESEQVTAFKEEYRREQQAQLKGGGESEPEDKK